MKKLIKPFIIVFAISFLIINWSDISWVFNYNFLTGALSGFFQEDIKQTSNSAIPIKDSPAKDGFKHTNKENSIEIPKIDIKAPLILGKSPNQESIEKELKKGVVLFPDSALPGQKGQTAILGHSAPLNWPKINYDWVFSNINNLEKGDKISVYFNQQEYNYYVIKKIFLNKGDEIPKNSLTNNNNMLVLVSCWPPGKDYKRIAVQAELIK
jgi:LPXTG-site transpeptidase (sortase) family protein